MLPLASSQAFPLLSAWDDQNRDQHLRASDQSHAGQLLQGSQLSPTSHLNTSQARLSCIGATLVMIILDRISLPRRMARLRAASIHGSRRLSDTCLLYLYASKSPFPGFEMANPKHCLLSLSRFLRFVSIVTVDL